MARIVDQFTRFHPLTKAQMQQWGGSVIGVIEGFVAPGESSVFGTICFRPGKHEERDNVMYVHPSLFDRFICTDNFFVGVEITLVGDELQLEYSFPPLADPEDKAKYSARAPVMPADSSVCKLQHGWWLVSASISPQKGGKHGPAC